MLSWKQPLAMEFLVVERVFHLTNVIPSLNEPKVSRLLFANGKGMPSELHADSLEP